MTINQIYQLAIKLGTQADPRGPAGVKIALNRRKKAFAELSKSKQKYFDRESLTNSYSDSRIISGSPDTRVDKVLVGIDIGSAEVLLADRLNQKGAGIDLIISHHPLGLGLAGLHEVVEIQIEMMAGYGIPINVAESLINKRISQVKRSISPINHNQAVDAAKILGIPILSVHTPADNLVYQFVTKHLDKVKPETVGEVVDLLLEIPEYQEAAKGKAGPMIQIGTPENRAGKIVAAEVTGGTEGSKEMYSKLSAAGVGTIISMHASEEYFEETKKHHLNRVVAGHISSDSIGMNLFVDRLEKRGVEIIPCSGFIRFSRN